MRLFILLMIMSAQTCAADAALGRLFSTPSERANLDHLRQSRKIIVPQPVNETPIQTQIIQPLSLPDTVEVQGYVKRSDGKQGTVWVNRQAVQEGTKSDEITVGRLPAHQNRVPIQINANGKVLSLKAGQSYDPETNRVREIRSSVQGEDAPQSGTIGNVD